MLIHGLEGYLQVSSYFCGGIICNMLVDAFNMLLSNVKWCRVVEIVQWLEIAHWELQ